MSKKNSLLWGIILIMLGLALIIEKVYNFDIITLSKLWPLFLILPGITFELSYFSGHRSPGMLVPGSILTILGIFFIVKGFTNWPIAEYTGTVFMLSVVLGLLQFYIYGKRSNGLLISISILTLLSIMNILKFHYIDLKKWLNTSYVAPLLLIILGVYIIYKNYSKKI